MTKKNEKPIEVKVEGVAVTQCPLKFEMFFRNRQPLDAKGVLWYDKYNKILFCHRVENATAFVRVSLGL